MSLKPGDRAPQIEGPGFKLSEQKGKSVVVFFFPKSDTPGCTKESCEFRDHHQQFAKKNTVVVGISPDKAEVQQRFAEKYGLTCVLVPDPNHSIAEAYGVWKKKSMYGRTYMGIERTTFVIDPRGKIAKIYPKVKPAGHAAQVLAELE